MNNIKTWKIDQSADRVRLVDVQLPHPVRSLNDSSRQLPGGAYTTFCTYHGGKVLQLPEQIRRLENSAKIVCCPVVIDEEFFRQALRIAILKLDKDCEIRIRVCVDLVDTPGDIFISIEPLKTPPYDDYLEGVKVITMPMERESPKAKLTEFISMAEKIRNSLPLGVHEVLMVGKDGKILEGLSSNFFAVRENKLWTPGSKVLSGITRAIVVEEAIHNQISVIFDSIHLEDIPFIEGAFITSASRGVLPIRSIDDHHVMHDGGNRVTRFVSDLYHKRIAAAVESI